MSTSPTICPDCGNALPSSVLGGICPFCLASSVEEELESRTPEGEVVVGPASYEQIGPYRILDRLGEGGYGVVYRAEQEHPLRRMVAIKIMKGGVVNEQAVARFEAERQALAMMEHPSIAHVYDVGETEEGLPYFVMELIEGLPISTWCEENKLSREERLHLFQQVCEAVGHAHRRGIIHRDLKPSNILVTGDGGRAHPKVIDFGIAKATETLLTERTLVTRDHQLVGTPAYMSPEQAEMRGGGVDTRADIYSLGVVLYELLTGTTPFRIEELSALPYDEALRKVRTEDPQRPSSRCRDLTRSGEYSQVAARDVQLEITTDLDWIVMKALSKEPERRYETAAAFGRDLARFLAGGAIEARPPTPAYLAGKFFRRHRIPVLAAVAVLVAMVAGTIVSLTMFVRAEREAERAVQNGVRAEAQAKLAQENDLNRMLQFSHSDLAQATPLLEDRRPGVAVAHLVRAMRTYPGYEAAGTRLLYTLASENWARPERTFAFDGSNRGIFTKDGSRIVIWIRGRISPPRVKIFDMETGDGLHEMQLDGELADMQLSPDGAVLATGTSAGTITRWDLESGEEVLPRFVPPRSGGPSQLRFSPDGKLLAVTQWETGALQIMEVKTGDLKATLSLPEARYVRGMAEFSDDGSRIGFASGKVLQVFEVESWETASIMMRHDGEIKGLALLPGGTRVVSWSEDATARVWNVASGEAELVLRHEAPIASGAVSPEGSRLLTGTGVALSEEGMVRLWDLETGGLIGRPHSHPGQVMNVLFSADGTKAASGSLVSRLGDGAVQVVDAWTGDPLLAPIFHPRGGTSLAFNPEGTSLAVSSRHHELVVWSLPARAMRPMRLEHPNRVWRAVFDRAGRRECLLTQSFGGETRRWDAETGELLSEGQEFGSDTVAAHAAKVGDTLRQGLQSRRELRRFIPSLIAPRYNQQGCVRVAAASDDGCFLATGCAHGAVRLWSLQTGELEWKPVSHGGGEVTAVAFDATGTRLASGGSDGKVNLWSLGDGSLAGSVPLGQSAVTALAFSEDGGTIAAGAEDGMTRLWWPGGDPELGPPMDNGSETGTRVNHLAFNPAGTVLAVSGRSNAARLWEVASGQPLGGPMAHIDGATYGLILLWSPDGERLVTTGSHDNTARVWDVRSRKMSVNPLLHPVAATSATLRPGGDALLYGARSSRVWDLGSGEPLTPMLRQDGDVYSSVFNEEGTRFATGTFGGSAYLWDFVDASGGIPEALTDYAGVLGGFEFNSKGVLERTPGSQFKLRQEEVARLGNERNDALGSWMRWLAEERSETRTISPYSKVTLGEHVDGLVRGNTPASLREALLLRPGDALIMGKLGYRLVTQPAPTIRELRYGGFLVRRAVDLAPENPDLKWMRALVILQERIRGVGRRGE